jgi:hypothetical protein
MQIIDNDSETPQRQIDKLKTDLTELERKMNCLWFALIVLSSLVVFVALRFVFIFE